MSTTDDALDELAGRLEGMAEELTDMAIDALRRATSGDPDSAEAGEALAVERRIVRARRVDGRPMSQPGAGRYAAHLSKKSCTFSRFGRRDI